QVPGVIGVGPFIINPMMVSHGDKTATGVLLKGVDPERMLQVLDLPRHIKLGSLDGLRRPGATPPSAAEDGVREPMRLPGLPPPTSLPRSSPRPSSSSSPSGTSSSGSLVPLPGTLPTGKWPPDELPRDDSGRDQALLRAMKEALEADARDGADAR